MFRIEIRHMAVAGLIAVCLAAAVPVKAADHDDTNLLKAVPRHEARLTDLHVFTASWPRGNGAEQRTLVLAVSTNPTIPPTAATYLFPADLTLDIRIDRTSEVDYAIDPAATQTYGGTIVHPASIRPDISFTITFDEAGVPRLTTSGLDPDTPLRLFAGMRDDPFIRGPRMGRNVASVVLELPLQVVASGNKHSSLLVWARSTVPGPTEPMGDLAGRALRSQFAENLALNDYEPADHFRVLGMIPDVVIFDTTRPAGYPNGRTLNDDVVDMVGNSAILATDCPVPEDPIRCSPSSNDMPFMRNFPYLAPPQGAASGNTGTILIYPAP